MKRLVLFLFVLVPVIASAQLQFGYLSYQQVIKEMPEYTQAMKELQTLKAKYDEEATRGETEFQKKFVDFLQGQKDFPQACTWFEQSAKDPRFADLSNYYLLECKFMQKDYRYVVENGIALYDSVPEERRPHLARILSESYLVMGDAKKARSYYDSILKEKPRMNRSDWFYAGSVLYAVEDWQGAVENFTMMTDRVDSLGQIANYQLGYAYIKTKNKVAAMDAFKDASVLAFDPAIQEDAYFNYAKLAFDLNHDTSVFNDWPWPPCTTATMPARWPPTTTWTT